MNKFLSIRITAVAALLCAGSVLFAQPGSTTADPSLAGGGTQYVNSSWKASKTTDGVYDRRPHISKPIAYPYLREEDILWKKRVWREIDTREKQNIAFRYTGDENSGGGMFIEILLDAIKRGKVTAYNSANDDRFTTVITKDEIMDKLAGKTDTITVMDDVTGTEIKKVIHHEFNPETIQTYRIKEDWIFDRNEGRMIVRIVGIAPVQDIYVDGAYRGKQAMFWLYYPDLRPILSNYEVVNPANDVARATWDDFFESRMFSSKVTKYSNPLQEDFKNMPGMSDMEALYQSRRATEEIFNKEHDMWVY